MTEPFPWTDLGDTWYAALRDGGRTYGLARRWRSSDGGARHEAWNSETRTWQFTSAGAGYFTEIGGITDAEPIGLAEALQVLTALGGSPDDLLTER